MYVAAMPHIPAPRSTAGGRLVRTDNPPNEELDVRTLREWLTPNDQFYVRCHGDVPSPEPAWRVEIRGLVERPTALDLDALHAMPQAEIVATLECAGNRRTLQTPVPGGVPWVEGAVSNARWAGVPFATVLARVGVRPEARYVRLIGGDRCSTGAGDAPFARSIPVDVARRSSALLALSMNAAPLPRIHGAPVRAVVPTHYAMDSVKWLRVIELADAPEPGPFQAEDYKLWFGDDAEGEEIGPVRVASVIAEPRGNRPVRAGAVTIRGAAWTGTGVVSGVDVSTDGGRSWRAAQLVGEAVPGAWQFWEIDWVATPGSHTLLARASDTFGNRQPDALRPNRKGYANNFVVPTPVRVSP
jgi:DMSO/TMAO reductase YedYZ molybdopterin-dependent catalytic subunit